MPNLHFCFYPIYYHTHTSVKKMHQSESTACLKYVNRYQIMYNIDFEKKKSSIRRLEVLIKKRVLRLVQQEYILQTNN